MERTKGRGCLFLFVVGIVGIIAYALLAPPRAHHGHEAPSTASQPAVIFSETNRGSKAETAEPAVPEPPPESKRPAAEDAPPSEVADAINEATLKALDSGKAEHWHKSHWTGYASVSAIQEIGGKECRNAYATQEKGDTKLTTSTQQWCRGLDSKWNTSE